jgi:hypothetical protein
MKTIKGFYVGRGEYGVREVEGHYTKLRKLINCDLIDIVVRKIGDTYYNIVCDDEGLFKENKIWSGITTNKGVIVEQIAGPIFITKDDGQGNLIGLEDKEVKTVLQSITHYISDKLDLQPTVRMTL